MQRPARAWTPSLSNQEEIVSNIIPQPPWRGAAAFTPTCAEIARQIAYDSAQTDSLMDALESRVIALEAVAAARWSARLVAAARLRSALRSSVRPYPGDSFAARRAEAASDAWLAEQAGRPAAAARSGPRGRHR